MPVEMLNIAGLEGLDRNAPVVMLNLMRFHARSLDGDGSGWDAYLRYSAITVPNTGVTWKNGAARLAPINCTPRLKQR